MVKLYIMKIQPLNEGLSGIKRTAKGRFQALWNDQYDNS
jgi:hypothetical protein